MLSNIGFSELIVILVIALVIFGPEKLPEIGKATAKTLREFKDTVNGVVDPRETTTNANKSQTDKSKLVPKADENKDKSETN